MTSPPIRVVLDTNTAVSALLFTSGRLTPLRSAWRDGRLLPLASTATVNELIRVLAYPKFALTAAEQTELLADYLPFAEVVAPSKPPRLPMCRDPADQMFLELAAIGGAHWLVTGDADLLGMAVRLPFEIIAPAKALARIFPNE